MGKKGLYKQTKGTQKKQKEKKAMFQNVAPAGRESTDPTGDIASGLFLVAMGAVCHLWSRTTFKRKLVVFLSYRRYISHYRRTKT